NVVASGTSLTMTWIAPSGRGCNGGGDWIALYRVGDPDTVTAANGHSDLWFTHTCGAASGTSTLTAPPPPGLYEIRLMGGIGSVARSNPVTVSAAGSPSPIIPALIIDGETTSNRQVGQTFWITGSGYTAGGKVSRHVDPATNGSTQVTPLTADQWGNIFWFF